MISLKITHTLEDYEIFLYKETQKEIISNAIALIFSTNM